MSFNPHQLPLDLVQLEKEYKRRLKNLQDQQSRDLQNLKNRYFPPLVEEGIPGLRTASGVASQNEPPRKRQKVTHHYHQRQPPSTQGGGPSTSGSSLASIPGSSSTTIGNNGPNYNFNTTNVNVTDEDIMNERFISEILAPLQLNSYEIERK